jgi:hypothetical protein
VNRVVLFCYDLALPRDFVPRVMDGEAEGFFTWSTEDACESMDPAYGDPMKPNCYPGECSRWPGLRGYNFDAMMGSYACGFHSSHQLSVPFSAAQNSNACGN